MSPYPHIRRLFGVGIALLILATPAVAAPAAPTAVADRGFASAHRASDISSVRGALVNTRFLTPRAGVRLSTRQPTLRWRGLPGGTTRVNLQVFRVDKGRATTVVSVFTSGRSYRVPRGRLSKDGLYLWRVWAQRGEAGYAPAPVGVSFFSVAPDAS